MYALANIRHVKKKDRFKITNGTTLEVAMLADVSGAYNAIYIVYQYVTGSL